MLPKCEAPLNLQQLRLKHKIKPSHPKYEADYPEEEQKLRP